MRLPKLDDHRFLVWDAQFKHMWIGIDYVYGHHFMWAATDRYERDYLEMTGLGGAINLTANVFLVTVTMANRMGINDLRVAGECHRRTRFYKRILDRLELPYSITQDGDRELLTIHP